VTANAERSHPTHVQGVIPAELAQSPLVNADLAPVPAAGRTWNAYHFAALWIGMSVCIPTYMLAAGLIAGGMSWWQAVLTIFLGNVIVLAPMILIAHAGTRYGIPFPVLARASFGVFGANVPALLRALVACGWFGIQTWIGGQAIHTLLTALWPGWAAVPASGWISFGAFWAANMYFIVAGTESIKWLEAYAAPFLIACGLLLLAWAVSAAGGFGPLLSQPPRFESEAAFWRFFWPSLTAMVGYWATLALNIPDLTRFAKSQRDQALGQALGLPTTMTLFAFIGVAVTSATITLYGEPLWDPVELVARIGSPPVVALSVLGVAVATLTTNIAANVVSPANGFSNVWPKRIDFVRGGILTGIVGIVMMPWKLLEDYGSYIFGWLVGYSGFLGPIAGVLIADYFLLRRERLETLDLYRVEGAYRYTRGWNPVAIAALVLGVAAALVGLLVPKLRPLYDYAWFVGFFVAAAAYLAGMRWPAGRRATA
jgi:NCS1 family nucleobase:cation symporter-1